MNASRIYAVCLLALSLLLVGGCVSDSLKEIRFESFLFSQFEGTLSPEVLSDTLASAEFVNSSVSAQLELASTTPEDIETISISQLSLALTAPSDSTFEQFESIWVAIEYEGDTVQVGEFSRDEDRDTDDLVLRRLPENLRGYLIEPKNASFLIAYTLIVPVDTIQPLGFELQTSLRIEGSVD